MRAGVRMLVIILGILLALGLSAGWVVDKAGAAQPKKATADHCIDWREFKTAERGTMSQIERELGVLGDGVVVSYQNHGENIVKQYPWCDHPGADGFVQIAYGKNRYGQYMANYISLFDFTKKRQQLRLAP